MLRAKHLGTLSQCARSFYLGGSRCGNLDGASCTCSDDQPCVPKRPAKPVNQQSNGTALRLSKAGRSTNVQQNVVAQVVQKDSSSRNFSADDNGTATLKQMDKATLKVSVKSETPSCVGAVNEVKGVVQLTEMRAVDSGGSYKNKPSRKPDSRGNSSAGITMGECCINGDKGATDAKSFSQQLCSKNQQQQPTNRTSELHLRGDSMTKGKLPASGGESIASSRRCFDSLESTRVHGGGGPSGKFRAINPVRPVERYFHTLQQLKWGPAAEDALTNLHCKLDVFQANQVLKLLRDPTVALGFFKWLKRQPGFVHDCHTYTTAIGILGQARQFGAMKKLVKEMRDDGCKPSVVTYNRIIHSYGRANFIDEAVREFQEMQSAGYEPDRVTYCTLIDIHAKSGYLDDAMDLYRRMQEVGLTPDTFTYGVMVNCLGKAGHLPAAFKLFCEMIERGCVPNLVTYNIMITLQAKARNFPCVVKLYKDMQEAGFRPDKITYSIVMEVLGHSGRLNEAEAVFSEMQRDWVPDEPVYGLLVDMWGKSGNVDKACGWYQAMLDAGLQPNVPTCNSLLSAFLKMRRFNDAFGILQSMASLGLMPSLQTYTLLLSSCAESNLHLGLCCQLMSVTGHPAHAFLLRLPDAEPDGRNVREHTDRFLDQMRSEDRESKRGLVDAVIHFLFRSGLKEEAGFVWEVAAQKNIYPDAVRETNPRHWLIDLHLMSEGTAITALARTLTWFQRRVLDSTIGLWKLEIVTGWGRRSRVTGSSLVRQAVERLLGLFEFPFFTGHGNSGCFVGHGEPLNHWILNSYIQRMHLL